MVVFAVCDKDAATSEKEEMAKKLFSTPRLEKNKLGKPSFPQIIFGENGSLPKLSSFVNEKSWLLFDLLGLDGQQEWLQTPHDMWVMFFEYRKLRDYVMNVTVPPSVRTRRRSRPCYRWLKGTGSTSQIFPRKLFPSCRLFLNVVVYNTVKQAVQIYCYSYSCAIKLLI